MQNQTNPQKEASILLIELTGFGKLSEKFGSDKASGFFNAIFEKSERIISFAGGRIDKYIGFCQLAVFESENKAEKTTEKALEAALEIRDHFNEFVSEHKLEQLSGIKIGMNSGPVILATIGVGDKKNLTVLGETVDSAMRIKDLAAEGKILAGLGCFEAGKDKFSFVALEPIPQPGKKEALRLYELVVAKRTSIHTESARQVVSEMVGRGTQYDFIQKRIRNLMDGKGSIVTISGKAGIGKSRLMAELRSTDLIKNAALHEGRAISTGQNLSYYPLIQILKSWAGIREEDNAAEAARKLEHQIRRMFPKQADEIFPFIATLMGYKLGGKAKQRVEGIEGEPLEKLILKNLRDLLQEGSIFRPIIIVIEDMHWADASTIAFLESLLKVVRNHPIMFIMLMRPGYMETGEHMLKYLEENLRDFCLKIFIEPLTQSESGELIENLLHKTGLPENTRQLIIDKAEGNPFFIEEVIRNFIDEGIIEVKENHFVVTEKIQTADVPATINEVILSRIEKLDEKTKNLLKTASAIGRNFYYKVLQEATDTISELDDKLEYLKDVQLISESRKKEEIEFLFKHALAQQATYESILLNSKKDLHLKIAKSIEKVFGDNIHEFYGTLAYHYEKAENLERTEEYLVKAGEEAMQSGASHEAYNHLKKGLEIYQKLYPVNAEKEKLANYYFNLSLACHRGGLNIEAIENIDQFQRLYLRQLPENKLRLILGLIWRLVNFLLAIHFPKYYFKKKPTELDDILIKLVIIKGQSLVTVNPKLVFFELIYFTSRMLSLDLARTNNGLGMLMESSGLFIWTGISIPFGKKIIHVVEKFIDKEKQATWIKLRYDQVLYRLFSGDFTPDADEDEVYRIGLKSGAFWETTTYLFFCTYIHLERGDWEKSCESRKRLLEAAEVFENEHSMVQYYRISGIAFSKFRKIDDMLENSTRGMDMISKTGHVTILMLVQCSRVLALALRGEFAEADKYIDEARNIIITRKRGVIFYSTYLITKIHLEVAKIHSRKTGHYSKEKKKELLKLTNEAIKVSKKYRGNLTEAYRLRGEVLYLSGKHGMALKYYKKAMDFGTKSGSRIETSRTYFHLGKLLSSPDIKRDRFKGFTAADYLEKAITMFEEMDLQWDLAELERFVEGIPE